MSKVATTARWSSAFIGGALVVGLQTPPDTAASNAALWIKKVTGYLPDLPPWADTAGTILGVLLILTPLALWLWKKRRSPKTVVDDFPTAAAEWMLLDDAIRYVADDSQWGHDQDQSDPNFTINVALQIQDALTCGDLPARGRKFHTLRGGVTNPPMHSLEPIESDFWKLGRVDAYWPLHHEGQNVGGRLVTSCVRGHDHEGMHDIRVERAKVHSIWPAASGEQRAGRRGTALIRAKGISNSTITDNDINADGLVDADLVEGSNVARNRQRSATPLLRGLRQALNMPPTRDRSLAQGLSWAYAGDWNANIETMFGDDVADFDTCVADILQHARDGTITIWGRPRPASPFEAIPTEHWRDHIFDETRLIHGRGQSEHWQSGQIPGVYYDLMISRDEFEREWDHEG